MLAKFHPLNCIIPPHMLREIAERGSLAQRQQAIRTLQKTDQFRDQRLAFAKAIEASMPGASAGKQRMVYDAQQGTSLPGRLARREGEPAGSDVAVNEAFGGSGATYDLYCDVYGRDSIDGQGMRLDSTVHYQKGYDNAFWNGQQMVYGDGDEDLPPDQRLFNRFTSAIDVIGHELTHGVTQYEANLIYANQSGALNETISDIFGSLVKQRQLQQTAGEADWIIGQGLFSPNVKGQGIRSMKAPGTAYDDPVLGKDPQPAHMKDYQNVSYDNGGVHINSGIPNHAFYVMAVEMGGYAWEKAGQIWYATLRNKLGATSQFQDAARLTIETAGELFGTGSFEQQAVRKGWAEVGISSDTGSQNPGCLAALFSLLRLTGLKKTT